MIVQSVSELPEFCFKIISPTLIVLLSKGTHVQKNLWNYNSGDVSRMWWSDISGLTRPRFPTRLL